VLQNPGHGLVFIMKLFLLIIPFLFLAAAKENCRARKRSTTGIFAGCYKGILKVKGPCMNYTISIVSMKFDSSLVVANWTDENTGKTYKNVFGLASRCTFPDSIKKGDEFYFVIDSTTVQNCAVCLIYYPTPAKKLRVKIIPGPCQ
jgi:hypothetical protein